MLLENYILLKYSPFIHGEGNLSCLPRVPTRAWRSQRLLSVCWSSWSSAQTRYAATLSSLRSQGIRTAWCPWRQPGQTPTKTQDRSILGRKHIRRERNILGEKLKEGRIWSEWSGAWPTWDENLCVGHGTHSKYPYMCAHSTGIGVGNQVVRTWLFKSLVEMLEAHPPKHQQIWALVGTIEVSWSMSFLSWNATVLSTFHELLEAIFHLHIFDHLCTLPYFAPVLASLRFLPWKTYSRWLCKKRAASSIWSCDAILFASQNLSVAKQMHLNATILAFSVHLEQIFQLFFQILWNAWSKINNKASRLCDLLSLVLLCRS